MIKGIGDNSPKLLLDEHVWAYLAKLLREQGFDVIHVNEADLIGTPDDKIMSYAVGEHRAVVTFNIKDFIPLAIQYYEGRWKGTLWDCPFQAAFARGTSEKSN